MRLTIICPAAHIADANNLAMVIGYGPADAQTYGEPTWQDAAGNTYAAASLPVAMTWVDRAQTALERPDWDTDSTISMAAARRAQALVKIWGLMGEEDDPTANPDAITALFHPDPLYVLSLAGVTRIEQREEWQP